MFCITKICYICDIKIKINLTNKIEMIAIKDYEKSNKETEVKYKSLSKKEYSDLLNAGTDIKNRKKAGQTLLDYL